MQFTIPCQTLLQPLSQVIGAVEKGSTMPILAHVKLQVTEQRLLITATDMEVELMAEAKLIEPATAGEITVSARKLMDICRNLSDDKMIKFTASQEKATITADRSRFSLMTLPVDEFPSIEEQVSNIEINLPKQQLRYLLETTHSGMAAQDARYILTGLLLSFTEQQLSAVSTDGHRLFLSKINVNNQKVSNLILPRKAVAELMRLLNDDDQSVVLSLTDSYIKVVSDEFTFLSKLIDGEYPDYSRVIPRRGSNELIVERDQLKQALVRVSVLAMDKIRGVRLQLSEQSLRISSRNPAQEEAEDELTVNYQGDSLEMGFNVSYLLDVLNTVPEGLIRFTFSDPSNSVLIESLEDEHALFVVMPMIL